MRSAEPMYHSCWPPLAKPKIRECSRNSPTIERTRIRSDRPGTPGRDRADPADDEVDLDAGLARPVERLDRGRVDDRVELEHDPRLAAGLGELDLALDQPEDPRVRRLCGATSRRRNSRWRDRPVSTLNRSVASAPSSGRHDSRPRSTYRRAVFGL